MISNMRIVSLMLGLLAFVKVRAEENVRTPDGDNPNYLSIPKSSFECSDQKYIPGFYADLETKCQVYHFCFENGKETFLCPAGSIFNQAKLACDTWQNSNCSLAPQLYDTNSGPLLENARKNVPMLIKLRNRSQNRSSVRETAANVYEKITSLYQSSTDLAQPDTDDSSLVNGIKAEQSPEISNEFESNVSEQTAEKDLLSEEDILSRLEANVYNVAQEDGVYYSDYTDGSQESTDMQANLLYDPVTEQYYVDHDSSQNEYLQGSEDVNQYAFNDYANFANKYRIALSDYAEVSSNLGNALHTNAEVDELHAMSNVEAFENEYLSKLLSMEQSRRLQQKPIYTVNGADDVEVELPSDIDGIKYPILGYAENFATESVAEVSSESAVQITSEESEKQSDTMAQFGMADDLSYPYFNPLKASEVPLPSEEFEGGILTELVLPKNEPDLKVLPSDRVQHRDESFKIDSRNLQRDDQNTYIENARTDDSEYAVYNTDDIIFESAETNMEAQENEDRVDFNQGNEETGEYPVESDTYVVIPDESDASEANKMPYSSDGSTLYDIENEQNRDNAQGSYASNYKPSYEFAGGYAYVDPSQYQPSQFSSVDFRREQFTRDGYIDPETREFSSPYEFAEESYYSDGTGDTGSEFRKYNFDDEDASNQYMFASQSPYEYDQSIGLTDYMYGTQNGYLYEDSYSNPYLDESKNYGYDPTDPEISSQSSASNIFVAGSDSNGEYSSKCSIPFCIKSDSSSDGVSEQIKTDDSDPEEIPANLYRDETLSANYDSDEALSPENMDAALDDGSMSKDETYYVFDFDNHENIEVRSDDEFQTSDVSENDQIITKESFQPERPLQSTEPSEAKDTQSVEKFVLENGNIDSDISQSSIDSQSKHETDVWSFQTTESDQQDEPVSFPTAGRLGRSDMEVSETSDTRNINLPNILVNNMAFPESMNFGRYGVAANMGQQQATKGSSTAFGLKNGRSGDAGLPNMTKLSALQERIRSLKQGKFGAFKKYVRNT